MKVLENSTLLPCVAQPYRGGVRRTEKLKENLDFHFNPFPLLTFSAIGECHVVRKYRGDKCLSLGYRLLANIPTVAIDSNSNRYFLAASPPP